MTQDQGELFAEIGGLFAPEMLACTPVEELRLLPGDHVETMRAELPDLDTTSAAAIRAQLTEHTTSHEPTLDDITGHAEDCPCEPCETILGPLDPDDDDQGDEADEAPHWTAEQLPTLAELAELLAPRVICDTWLSVSDHDATERLRRGLASGGCGGGRGMIQWENAGPTLQLFEGDGDEMRTTSHRVCAWRDLAAAVRAADDERLRAELVAALGAHARLIRADNDDPRPFVPAATLKADSVKRMRHERDDEGWRARHAKRLASKRPILDDLDQLRAEVVRRIADATAAPVALF